VTTLLAPAVARAEEVESVPAPADASTSGRPAAPSSNAQRIYLDVRIDGEPAGRLEIELLSSAAPVGSQRFADLAEEKGGVGYRLAKWDGIFVEKNYLRNAGAKSLSYSADGVSQVAGGDSTLALEREMDNPARPLHDRAGLVSLVVREAEARPTKERLVAMGGKLVTVTSQAGEAPNGSAFCVTLGPAPDLDKTNLVVGRLVPGPGTDAAIAALASLPVNRPREGIQKPFFEAGKALNDSRAIVAEKGFYRPLRRAIISGGGPVV
jgi:peptidyl-prolyl cis-trans isomerase B (cyclophilin B)